MASGASSKKRWTPGAEPLQDLGRLAVAGENEQPDLASPSGLGRGGSQEHTANTLSGSVFPTGCGSMRCSSRPWWAHEGKTWSVPTRISWNRIPWDRVDRGGSWFNIAGLCRSAARHGNSPGVRDYGLGCRLARSL